jgi:predicted DCC family thiol-disulfide oxidoreductase YuxK
VTETFKIGGRLLVLFDGHCGLCNRSVWWLLRRDRRERVRFASFESPQAIRLLDRNVPGRADPPFGLNTDPDTVLVVRDAGGPGEQLLIRSNAVLAILAELPGPWLAVGVVLGWIPRPVRDLGYRLVARWRYRIWGRVECCPVPTPAEQERFL